MYQATITGQGDQKYHAATRQGRFELSSDGSAPGAIEALLASLCACLAHHLGDHLTTEKISFTQFSITGECALAADHSRVGDIDVVISIDDCVLDAVAKAAAISAVQRCCIHNTLKASSRIVVRFATGGV
jgi:uncharacterized OsmC-like protein